jgi:hypothetical protein
VSRDVAGEELEWRWWIQSSVWNASAGESEMEKGEATECFIPARKGGEACTGARHDDGKPAGRRGGAGRARGRRVGVRGGRWEPWAARHDSLRRRRPAAEGKQRRKKNRGAPGAVVRFQEF